MDAVHLTRMKMREMTWGSAPERPAPLDEDAQVPLSPFLGQPWKQPNEECYPVNM